MENIGLKRGARIELLDYSEDYTKIYEKEKEELLKIYKDKIYQIDHVGSTSIKGIKSKPIIDIVIQTNDLEDFKKFTESNVEGKTYTVKKEPTLGGDYLIRKEEKDKVKALIHVYKTGDMNGITSIIFRDYLNKHYYERKKYEELKINLYNKYKDERKKYTSGKDSYIKKIINKAINELEQEKRGYHMKELRDLYDKNGNKTGLTYYKGKEIPNGYYPMVVMVVIRNSEGKFLMQKRVEAKGGDWGVTGGHPKSGESPEEGIITEIKEELGLDFSKEKFIEYNSGCDGKDCYKMYLVNKDIEIKDITIQKEELSEVRWFTMEELKKMVETKELNEDQIACFNKACNFLNTTLHK